MLLYLGSGIVLDDPDDWDLDDLGDQKREIVQFGAPKPYKLVYTPIFHCGVKHHQPKREEIVVINQMNAILWSLHCIIPRLYETI